MRFLWVGVGGAVGSMLRYGVGLILANQRYPLGTLAVNIVGSFAIGFVLSFGVDRWSSALTTALAVGVIGGFTTFSTFAWETLSLSQTTSSLAAGVYVGLSLLGGLLAAVGGGALGRSLG
jgi:CrcB protein